MVKKRRGTFNLDLKKGKQPEVCNFTPLTTANVRKNPKAILLFPCCFFCSEFSAILFHGVNIR